MSRSRSRCAPRRDHFKHNVRRCRHAPPPACGADSKPSTLVAAGWYPLRVSRRRPRPDRSRLGVQHRRGSIDGGSKSPIDEPPHGLVVAGDREGQACRRAGGGEMPSSGFDREGDPEAAADEIRPDPERRISEQFRREDVMDHPSRDLVPEPEQDARPLGDFEHRVVQGMKVGRDPSILAEPGHASAIPGRQSRPRLDLETGPWTPGAAGPIDLLQESPTGLMPGRHRLRRSPARVRKQALDRFGAGGVVVPASHDLRRTGDPDRGFDRTEQLATDTASPMARLDEDRFEIRRLARAVRLENRETDRLIFEGGADHHHRFVEFASPTGMDRCEPDEGDPMKALHHATLCACGSGHRSKVSSSGTGPETRSDRDEAPHRHAARSLASRIKPPSDARG